jgi:hypothetical protein
MDSQQVSQQERQRPRGPGVGYIATKLDRQALEDIRSRNGAGERLTDLAREYGVGYRPLLRMLSPQAWAREQGRSIANWSRGWVCSRCLSPDCGGCIATQETGTVDIGRGGQR